MKSQHETLGSSECEGNPTLGDAITELTARRDAELTQNEALPLSSLAGLRLGRLERWYLLHAPAEPKGTWIRASGVRGLDESMGRARRKLQRHGLVGYLGGYYLLPLGRKVVERYRLELETGGRIRWPLGVS